MGLPVAIVTAGASWWVVIIGFSWGFRLLRKV